VKETERALVLKPPRTRCGNTLPPEMCDTYSSQLAESADPRIVHRYLQLVALRLLQVRSQGHRACGLLNRKHGGGGGGGGGY
jgi:hypothetical protein